MSTKTLIFEGAGWPETESSGDVGNCRIRGTFYLDNGKQVYLELTGTKVHKYMPARYSGINIISHISHLFDTRDQDTGYSQEFRGLDRKTFEWNKRNILNFVNALGCSFEEIEVRNEKWCGFSPDGNIKNDFHLKIKGKSHENL